MKIINITTIVLTMGLSPIYGSIVAFEAESGTLGGTLAITADANASGGNFIETTLQDPGAAVTVGNTATYSVPLAADTYDIYVRIFVGPQGGNDDSFFAPDAFGTTPNFINHNQISGTNLGVVYVDVDGILIDTVTEDQTYYWLNLSEQAQGATALSTTGGTETFQVVAREDGFRIDALALVSTSMDPNSAALDAALIPEPSSALLATLGAFALLRRRR